MSMSLEKNPTPAYGSFKTLISFANDVREGGHVPMQIDRTLMPKLSGSAATETISTLKFLGLVHGEKAKPTEMFDKFVMASDEKRKEVLPGIVRNSYAFLFNAPGFDIERASSQQVADLFRGEGVNGSTLVRAIAFFLASAKDAEIKVSNNVKPPKSQSNSSRSKKEKKPDIVKPLLPRDIEPPKHEVHRFELPIPGKPSVIVLIPQSLDSDDWDMFKDMFNIYVNRWKNFNPTKEVLDK